MKFHDALKLFKRLVNIGVPKSLAAPRLDHTPSAHGGGAERAGRHFGMIRLCGGIEALDDILADIDQGLAAAGA